MSDYDHGYGYPSMRTYVCDRAECRFSWQAVKKDPYCRRCGWWKVLEVPT